MTKNWVSRSDRHALRDTIDTNSLGAHEPMRIVSLYPAATEIVALLGLAEQLVGISHECDFPQSIRSLPQVTKCTLPPHASSAEIDAIVRQKMSANQPLYEIDSDLLQRLEPDIVLTQSLCKVCAVDKGSIEQSLGSFAATTIILALQPVELSAVLEDIERIATAADTFHRSQVVIDSLRNRIQSIEQAVRQATHRPTVVMLEWIEPLFCSGHWTPELIRIAGGDELIGQEKELSTTISIEQLIAASPDILLFACCGYSRERTCQDIQRTDLLSQLATMPAVKNSQIYIGDGNAYFNRPGPRLVDTLEMLAATFHPNLFASSSSIPRLSRYRDLC